MLDLKRVYHRRFHREGESRVRLWKILCDEFFQKYVPENSTVLEIAAGYCEFINNIRAAHRMAIDLNPDIRKFAAKDVRAMVGTSDHVPEIAENTIDVVLVSNFFEHLEKSAILATLKEVRRILKPGGRLLILQPNIRFCYKDYWMFFDHVTPLDDRSMGEALEISGFSIRECRPRFLPYTTKSRLAKSPWVVRLYLKMRWAHAIFGLQMFIWAEKTKEQPGLA